MSGGFFRGTSSEQDTRFSNKQAKLLKSQKFAPELEHLVDISKVKMDVIRPWIATRVTELLGFEDEVLINFIYGLLDGKEVNGKEVQISLTGFMEKNTVKFMKELWTLLLSAQRNGSGIPQQFLDAREEENRKKKAEADQIANEIQNQKKIEKESRELEQERLRKMDDEVEMKANNAYLEPTSKHYPRRSSSVHSGDDNKTNGRNGFNGRSRVSRSPHSIDNSPVSHRAPQSQSPRKSLSRSKSYSSDRHKSRSISRSPATRGRSISSERMFRSPRRRSIPPRRRYSTLVSLSPPRRSSYSRRRSRSRSRRRSPSPEWRRMRSPYRDISPSPVRRRLPSPVRRRRSPSPIWRRSPSPARRRRSPSPVRRRSPSNLRRRSPLPVRHRSPSPLRRGSPSPVWRGSPSPIRRRSPLPARRRSPIPTRRRSPIPARRRSPSPVQRRSTSVRRRQWKSPSTPLRRSPSLVRNTSPIPIRRKSPGPTRRRSPSPYESSSPSLIQNRSGSPNGISPVDNKRSTKESPRENIRTMMKAPEKDPKDSGKLNNKALTSSSSPEGGERRSIPNESARRKVIEHMVRDDSSSPHRRREQKPRHEIPSTSNKEATNSRGDVDLKSKSQHKVSSRAFDVHKQIDSPVKVRDNEEYSPKRLAGHRFSDKMESRKREQEKKSEKSSGKVYSETSEHQRSPALYKDLSPEDKHQVSILEEDQSVQRHKYQTLLVEKAEKNNRNGSYESGSDDSGKHIIEKKDKRKHKRSEKRQMASDDDYSSDSEIEDRKEAKRRRKEEKKLRKEEKRRRHEERRRKKEQRRAEKLKAKNQNDADSSEGENARRKASRRSDDEGAQSEQKKLEIELRNKALESLKAKKGISR